VEGYQEFNYGYFIKLLKSQCPEIQSVFEDFKKQYPSENKITKEIFVSFLGDI
jgi:hypothetical protein